MLLQLRLVVAKTEAGGLARPTGILPLRLGRQTVSPIGRQTARLVLLLTELLAEFHRLLVSDIIHGIGAADPIGGSEARLPTLVLDGCSHDLPPLALCHFELTQPEAVGESHGCRVFVLLAVLLLFPAAHGEASGRAPTELHL